MHLNFDTVPNFHSNYMVEIKKLKFFFGYR